VVVLIMAIVAGASLIAVNVVSNARTEKAAMLVSNVLRQARQKAISIKNDGTSSQVYLHIYKNDGNYFADLCKVDGSSETKLVEEKLGNDSVSITLRHADVTNPSNVSDTLVVGEEGDADAKIYFKKTTGGISQITVGGHEYDMNEIIITGVGDDRKIILVGATGRAYYAE